METWDTMCSPAKFYILFMIALILFDFYQGYGQYAMRHTVYLVFGGIALFVLCAANMDFAAWGLLLVPIIFYIFLIALWTFDQSFYSISRTYNTSSTYYPSTSYPSIFSWTPSQYQTPSITLSGKGTVPNWDEWDPKKVVVSIDCNGSDGSGNSACSA